ncbi:UNVERIFIED_CONTAM: hypothetical protein Sangu_3222000 [Sesamum angustifolium]|uniref:Uncharacterized protein n=1 Tax=Sesamum angustifolium TaxID=2727405 RepID=A0AAW2JJ56_9LAMI
MVNFGRRKWLAHNGASPVIPYRWSSERVFATKWEGFTTSLEYTCSSPGRHKAAHSVSGRCGDREKG